MSPTLLANTLNPIKLKYDPKTLRKNLCGKLAIILAEVRR
jgi:hypothetical protein